MFTSLYYLSLSGTRPNHFNISNGKMLGTPRYVIIVYSLLNYLDQWSVDIWYCGILTMTADLVH